MKSHASWRVTSTMYSLAPMPSNGGIVVVRQLGRRPTSRPQPECAKPTTPPCFLPHCRIGRSQLGQSSIRVVAGVVLLLQPQQAEVARSGCEREAGDLDVVAHQVRRASRAGATLPSKNCFWWYQHGPQRQDAADVEVLAQDVPHHVLGRARPRSGSRSARSRRRGRGGRRSTSPCFAGSIQRSQRERLSVAGLPPARRSSAASAAVLRAARARRRCTCPAAAARVSPSAAVDLRVEEEVRGQPLGRRRVDAALLVAEDERRRRRPAVLVAHVAASRRRAGSRVEQDVDSLRKPRSCVPWPTSKRELRLALAGVAAVELDDAVLEGRGRRESAAQRRSLKSARSIQRSRTSSVGRPSASARGCRRPLVDTARRWGSRRERR